MLYPAAAFILLPLAVCSARQACSCTNIGNSLPPWASAARDLANGCPADGPDPSRTVASANGTSSFTGAPAISQCDLTYADFIAALKSKQNVCIIDVRQPDEISETGMMPGAFNVPLDQLEKALGMVDENFKKSYGVEKPQPPGTGIIFSCRSGRRSRLALEIAQKAGYTMSKHYIGGWSEYATKQANA